MPPECPQLRPYLAAAQDDKDPRYMIVWDRLGLGGGPQRLTVLEFFWLQLFDGQRTLRDVQAEAMRQLSGQLFPMELFTALADRMDEALFLDGPRFRECLASPIREPSCIGCYDADPVRLREQLRGLFTSPRGPGLPAEKEPDGRLRAALVPHMDYHRGGATYAWGFKEVVERTDASLFVIVGTSHYSPHRFTLTRKHFKTPLGVLPTDQGYIDRLVGHYGDGLFDDELAHLPEHSIELEVVFLQFLYENRRPLRIVPLLVGPFQDCVESGVWPHAHDDIGRMVEALRQAEAGAGEPVCYIISGDLAHIGPKFGDPHPVGEPVLSHSRSQDQAILRQAEAADPVAYFRVIAAEGDARRICGLPPTFTVLEALKPGQGRLLHYDQYVHPRGFESVSFASMAFYR
jgi:AmmeMemoRadiSam system protein B